MTPQPSQVDTRPTGSPRPLGAWSAASRIFDLSLGEMLWSRRTVFMALLAGVPIVVALVLRLLSEAGVPVMSMGRTPVPGSTVFGVMMWVFFVRFSVPVLGIFYGTALIGDEVDDKTITYLFTRPIPRGTVLLGKYLAYLVCTVFVVLPAVVITWLLLAPINDDLARNFVPLLKDLGVLAIGLAAYGGVFAFIGAALKRPLLFGLAFVFGWEVLVMALPGFLKHLTVAYYLQALVPHPTPPTRLVDFLRTVAGFTSVPAPMESLVSLGLICLVTLWAAARAVARRDYVLDQ